MKGGLFNKQISLPLLSIVLSILVVLFAGWLLFTLGKREGFQEGATTPSASKSLAGKPSSSSPNQAMGGASSVGAKTVAKPVAKPVA